MVNKHQNMQNEDIIKIIDNLKGRKNYEQKKAAKLGFSSLYEYFEDKILKKKAADDLKIKELEEASKATKKIKKDSKSCTCC
tara:strand:- start:556 stop:801 length:246 start_codon:yes stop_codon:yes gene_type:complete